MKLDLVGVNQQFLQAKAGNILENIANKHFKCLNTDKNFGKIFFSMLFFEKLTFERQNIYALVGQIYHNQYKKKEAVS